jgi:hypothetical protein
VEQWFKPDEAMINSFTQDQEKEIWAKKVVLN